MVGAGGGGSRGSLGPQGHWVKERKRKKRQRLSPWAVAAQVYGCRFGRSESVLVGCSRLKVAGERQTRVAAVTPNDPGRGSAASAVLPASL